MKCSHLQFYLPQFLGQTAKEKSSHIRFLNKRADGPKALLCGPEPLYDPVIGQTDNVRLKTLKQKPFFKKVSKIKTNFQEVHFNPMQHQKKITFSLF